MKKQLFLVSLLLVGASTVFAQYTVTRTVHSSYDSRPEYMVPADAMHEISRQYRGYEWEHVEMVQFGRRTGFEAVLRKGDISVAVSFGHGGRVYREVYYERAPVRHHTCNKYCHDSRYHHHKGKGKGHHKHHKKHYHGH